MSPDRGTGALPVPPKAPAPDTPDQLISLLGGYAARYASYTTLLWQLPALSLTAWAFLLTIALSHSDGVSARVTAAALSAVISAASYALMKTTRSPPCSRPRHRCRGRRPQGTSRGRGGGDRGERQPGGSAGLSGRDLLAAPRAG